MESILPQANDIKMSKLMSEFKRVRTAALNIGNFKALKDIHIKTKSYELKVYD